MSNPTSPEPLVPVSIRNASWRDINTVRRLEQICFPRDAWPLLDIVGVLTLPNVVRLKAELNGDIVGFIAVDIRNSQNLAWIATVGVLPEYRGRGIGKTLLTACEARTSVSSLRLNVRPSNLPAIRLYRHLDYQQIGVWPRYYQDGEDALIFEKKLSRDVEGTR